MTRSLILVTATIALALALFLVTTVQGSSTTYVRGDIDCDADVTMPDAARTLLTAASLGGPDGCVFNGDVNCDGYITVDDTMRIVAYVAGAPMPPPQNCSQVGSLYQKPPTPTPTATLGAPTPTTTPNHTPTPQSDWVTSVEPECDIFPEDNPWNTDISQLPVHANSANYLASIGTSGDLHPDFGTIWDGAPIGIPYVIVGGSQPQVPVSFYYDEESDPGPYPIPNDVPVEGQPVGQPNTANWGGDRHVLVVDDDNCLLYETFDSRPVNGGLSWTAGAGAVWDLNSNVLRPETWTSADAAGLPIFAGLVRYSEVQSGVIGHALRFTVSDTQMAYIHPATHYASDINDANYPPMGARFRMKANYDCSWATSEVQVICAAMKKYGMIVADNGADWYISGAPDSRWDDDRIGDLKDVPSSAFEVVDTGEPIHTGY